MPECRDLIRGTLRYQGFPKFVKALVALGFLSDAPVSYLSESAAPITWQQVLQNITHAVSTDEYVLVAAAIQKGKIESENVRQVISGLRWYYFI